VTAWAEWVDDQCRLVSRAGQWRTTRTFDAAGPTGTLAGVDSPVTSFASNDYLGLTQHPAVKDAASAAVERWGTGAGASRLVVGSRPDHELLEAELADWRGTEAALVFSTGFAANTGTLATLAGRGTRVCSDERNHASIIDGCRMARERGADVRVYRHGDLDHLAAQLKGIEEHGERALVVTDTVFSMDGDVAPIDGIAELCRRHDALLVLDDAHWALDEDRWSLGDVDLVRVGTLSKTLGSLGGFVAATRPLVDLLINRARPFIFTTALTPADTAAARAALAVVRAPQGAQLKAELRDRIEMLHPGHPSPILPVIVGDEQAALDAAAALLARGLLVPAIRPPTVAPGTSRLRVALSAAHSREQIATLRDALDALGLRT